MTVRPTGKFGQNALLTLRSPQKFLGNDGDEIRLTIPRPFARMLSGRNVHVSYRYEGTNGHNVVQITAVKPGKPMLAIRGHQRPRYGGGGPWDHDLAIQIGARGKSNRYVPEGLNWDIRPDGERLRPGRPLTATTARRTSSFQPVIVNKTAVKVSPK